MPRGGVPELEDAIWIRAEDDELPHPVLIRLGLGEDGRLVATGVLIDAGGELTTRALRLPLAGIVAEFAAKLSRPAFLKRLWHDAWGVELVFEPQDPERVPEPWRLLLPTWTRRHRVRRVRPGQRGHPDEHYRNVAQAYRRAKREHPRAPVRALMKELDAAEPTVHRWLRTARERGFLKED